MIIDCESVFKEADGECLGFSLCDDDEPIDKCKNCKKHTGYEPKD